MSKTTILILVTTETDHNIEAVRSELYELLDNIKECQYISGFSISKARGKFRPYEKVER